MSPITKPFAGKAGKSLISPDLSLHLSHVVLLPDDVLFD